MIRSAIATLLAILSATPAFATGGVYCDSPADTTVAVELTVGRVPGFAVVGARIAAGDRTWEMNPAGDATPIVRAQGAVWGELTLADFTDENAEEVLVSLRVVRAENDVDYAAAGTLSIPGTGAWPVVCEID